MDSNDLTDQFERRMELRRRDWERGQSADPYHRLRCLAGFLRCSLEDVPPGTGRYLGLMGEFQLLRGDFSEAARLFLEAARRLTDLGHGDDERLPADLRQLAADVERLPPWASDDTIRRAQELNRRGLVAHRSRTEEAVPLFERAISLARPALGDSHPELLTLSLNLAAALHDRGDVEAAERRFRDIEGTVRAQGLSPESFHLARCLEGRSVAARDRRDLLDASILTRGVLQIYRRVLPAEHPGLLIPLRGLAELAAELGSDLAAEGHLQEILSILGLHLGRHHAGAVGALDGLAKVYCKMERFEAAEALWAEALKTVGRDPIRWRNSAIWRRELGRLARRTGRREKARRILQEGWRLTSLRQRQGPEAAGLIVELGLLARDGGRLAAAEALLLHAVGILETMAGPQATIELARARNSLFRL